MKKLFSVITLASFFAIFSFGLAFANQHTDGNVDTDPGAGQDVTDPNEPGENVTPTPTDDNGVGGVEDADTTEDETPTAAPRTGFGTLGR